MRAAPVLVLVVLLAGCLAPSTEEGPAAAPESTAVPQPDTPPGPARHEVQCRLVDVSHAAVTNGTCRFLTVRSDETVSVDADGSATRAFEEGTTVRLTGRAPGREPATLELVVDAPKSVELTLVAIDAPGPTEAPTAPEDAGPPIEPDYRPWRDPVTVTDSGNEPHLAVDSQGIVYYSPLNAVFRSTDGGATWSDISPSLMEALPPLASDTSISIAPDDSLWFSRTWGYADGTIGCTSTDHGDSWTCNSNAVPGATDRMWIVGLSSTEGYVQTNEGLEWHVWSRTTDGSATYVPYATATSTTVRNGPMVYDEVHDAIWQVEFTGGTQRLLRIDGQTGLVPRSDTGVPNTYALPWLSVWNGTLWMTGEVEGEDGSRSVLAARSMDGGKTWDQFPIRSAAKSVTFSYIAAGPDGRVGLVYYGSDSPGPSTDNMGVWSLYVAETDGGLSETPTWVETRLVEGIHTGNVCIGLNCEDSGGDPEARFSGDLIGAWMDADGDLHLAYNDDSSGTNLNQYLRQDPSSSEG